LPTYVDAIEQNATSKRPAAAAAAGSAIGGGSIIHRLTSTWGFNWLAAAADGGGFGEILGQTDCVGAKSPIYDFAR